MVEVKDISTDSKTCKIHEDLDGTFVVELIDNDLAVMAGPFSSVAAAEVKGAELLEADHISGEMLVGDVPRE